VFYLGIGNFIICLEGAPGFIEVVILGYLFYEPEIEIDRIPTQLMAKSQHGFTGIPETHNPADISTEQGSTDLTTL
jgi:hypothetical protein